MRVSANPNKLYFTFRYYGHEAALPSDRSSATHHASQVHPHEQCLGESAGRTRRASRRIRELVELGIIKPANDRVYRFEQVIEAHKYVEMGHKNLIALTTHGRG